MLASLCRCRRERREMDYPTNVWSELAYLGEGVRGVRLERIRGETLASAVWELDPGAESDYHFHHGAQELILVLRGRVTLRTKEGERELSEGDVVAFPRGADGAHGTANRTDEPVRYLMVAAHDTPEVIEYPDRATIAVASRTPSQDGEPLFLRFRRADAVVSDR
jgi:uncharacterized cupin superfamily protein